MYKTAIFDLDGTILDTLEDLQGSVNYALGSFGYPLRSIDEVREFVGNGIKKLIERAVPAHTDEASTQKVLECFKLHYGKNCDVKTKPYDGITDCFKMLKGKGIKIAVVTNKAHFAAVPLCEKYFGNLIDVTIGEKENVRKKPWPDSVFEAIRLVGANVDDCVYIGDSDVDIQTAKNAKIPCISVTWGFRDESFLLQSGASVLAHTVGEMTHLIVHSA